MRRPPNGSPSPEQRGAQLGPAERRAAQRFARPTPAQRAEILTRQKNLADRVASFWRDQRRDARVGLAAGALLVAAAGGALAYDLATGTDSVALAAVAPLGQEVREGLPSEPGRYSIVPTSVTRDARGVYHFVWLDPTATANNEREASVSNLLMAPGETNELGIPVEGEPVLYLTPDTPVGVVAETAEQQTAAAADSGTSRTTGGWHGSYVHIGSWYPYIGSYTSTPLYRTPPSAEVYPQNGSYVGSRESVAPPPPAQRTLAVPPRLDAVSGQARGTGGGSAVTGKSTGSNPSVGGVSQPRSSGFTSGSGRSNVPSIS